MSEWALENWIHVFRNQENLLLKLVHETDNALGHTNAILTH